MAATAASRRLDPGAPGLTELSGWGRYPRSASRLVVAHEPDEAAAHLARHDGLIARGQGRAYGDAAIGASTTLSTRGLDRMQAFDPATGRLVAEAGVTLDDILATFVPRGFFPPVVPGTRFVTVGGMIAADVHGKNHHRDGGFGDHLEAMTLLLPDGSRISCTRDRNAELFAATLGGMGLTGIILSATFRLRRIETGWIAQTTRVAADLAGALALLDEAREATYSVAWVDGSARGGALGRGFVFTGEHAALADFPDPAPRSRFPVPRAVRMRVPVDLPNWTLNRLSVSAFNALYVRRGAARAGAPVLTPWDAYFFPLDGLADWNRLYGRSGFVQYQCVVPTAGAQAVLGAILDRVAHLGIASPLAVLKRLGASHGRLSFPLEGYTLALDLAATPAVLALLDACDGLVREAGGRLYLAKDARQSRDMFEAGYPGLPAFRALRRDLGLERRLASRLSARLGI